MFKAEQQKDWPDEIEKRRREDQETERSSGCKPLGC
jgi:hypothetical protein